MLRARRRLRYSAHARARSPMGAGAPVSRAPADPARPPRSGGRSGRRRRPCLRCALAVEDVEPPRPGARPLRGHERARAAARLRHATRRPRRPVRLLRGERRPRRSRLLPGQAERARSLPRSPPVRRCDRTVLPAPGVGRARPATGDRRRELGAGPGAPRRGVGRAAARGAPALLRLAHRPMNVRLVGILEANALMVALGLGLSPLLGFRPRALLAERLALAYAVGFTATGTLAAELATVRVPTHWWLLTALAAAT